MYPYNSTSPKSFWKSSAKPRAAPGVVSGALRAKKLYQLQIAATDRQIDTLMS
jgi:hypothetical protein